MYKRTIQILLIDHCYIVLSNIIIQSVCSHTTYVGLLMNMCRSIAGTLVSAGCCSKLEAILCAILFGTVRLCQFKICQIHQDVIWYIGIHKTATSFTHLLFAILLQVCVYKPWNSDKLFYMIPIKKGRKCIVHL